MSIDPARLRPLDKLRLLEIALENVELMATIRDLRDGFATVALIADEPDVREAARVKYLAIDDIEAAMRSRMSGYQAEVAEEMRAEKMRAERERAA